MRDFTSTVLTDERRPIQARDLHPGDIVQQHDWPLHVRTVTLDSIVVTIAVTEFEFPLHYAVNAELQVDRVDAGLSEAHRG